ncbi:hypothetical protein F4801DRAFT_175938 [Xylaria longipes]|nr:hypothetical protein F4801DRAFT_175938 [Xylaria longipes]RYC63988.1 hypothetical protein CHU98_g2224 [Xylaria longipes]
MPPTYPQLNPTRQSTSVKMPILKEPHQSRASSSSPSTSLSPSAKTGSARTPVHSPRSSQRRGDQPLTQPSRLRYEDAEYLRRTLLTESQRRSHHSGSRPSTQQQALPGLRTVDILNNPRLQQVTGLLPRKVDTWSDRVLPPDELYRLAWAMALPEPFPSKRPQGEQKKPIALKAKKL